MRSFKGKRCGPGYDPRKSRDSSTVGVWDTPHEVIVGVKCLPPLTPTLPTSLNGVDVTGDPCPGPTVGRTRQTKFPSRRALRHYCCYSPTTSGMTAEGHERTCDTRTPSGSCLKVRPRSRLPALPTSPRGQHWALQVIHSGRKTFSTVAAGCPGSLGLSSALPVPTGLPHPPGSRPVSTVGVLSLLVIVAAGVRNRTFWSQGAYLRSTQGSPPLGVRHLPGGGVFYTGGRGGEVRSLWGRRGGVDVGRGKPWKP